MYIYIDTLYTSMYNRYIYIYINKVWPPLLLQLRSRASGDGQSSKRGLAVATIVIITTIIIIITIIIITITTMNYFYYYYY